MLEGGDGNDRIEDGAVRDVSSGGPGDDVLLSQGGDDELDGGEGDDELRVVTPFDRHARILRGGPGNDMLVGGREPDILEGGPDNDSLNGDRGHDWLSGDDGDDSLEGALGNDDLHGGDGDDNLDGGLEADEMVGDEGFDTVRYDERTRPVVVTIGPFTPPDGSSEDCRVNDDDGGDCFEHSPPGDNVEDAERLIATPSEDDITGDDRDNVLVGGGGPDQLSGLGGNDTIEARDGVEDMIVCGAGVDTVIADDLEVVDDASCEVVERA
jgi:Ca2+-binding RTX toxin-like protein